MITVAGIDDQELPITTEFASINYPAITGRSYLCGKARLDHNSLRLATELRLFAECQRPAALRGRRQFGSGLCEGDGRLDSAWAAGDQRWARRRQLHHWLFGTWRRRQYGDVGFGVRCRRAGVGWLL